MKLNNKGFAISSVMYLILVMVLIIVAILLQLLNNRRYILDAQKRKLINNIATQDIESLTTYSYYYSKDGQTYNYGQEFSVPRSGLYKIELWGPKGGSVNGSYTSGLINLTKGDMLYLYVGATSSFQNSTDIRLNSSTNSRIMVAAGGSSGYANNYCSNSFVSGYIGCRSVDSSGNITNSPIHYSNYVFSNPEIKTGSESMPAHSGSSTMTGNNGNGFAKITFISYDLSAGDSTKYKYTGSQQQFNVSTTGYYKLETWGAQGGEGLCQGLTCGAIGGYGAYSVGYVYLVSGETLYISVGGKGEDGVLQTDSNNNYTGKDSLGGYNGGGLGTWDHNDNEVAGGGGGATHIALSSGLLSSLSSNLNSILIISGGGGGGSWEHQGGSGGGINGGPSGSGSVATQSSGNSFGQGKNATALGQGNGHGGGGGGYYGGYESSINSDNGDFGGGGSGYIGNSRLTNKHMYCYDCTTSDVISTYTNSGTCVKTKPTSDCAKEGDGYAKVTFIGPNDYYANNTSKTYAAGAYDDTGFKINWNKDFTIEATINFSTASQRYMVVGSYDGSSGQELNVEINSNKLRVWIGSDGQTDVLSSGTVYTNEDVKVTFYWDSENDKFVATAVGTQTNASLTGSRSMSGETGNSLRIGACDYRGYCSTFKSLTLKSVYIFN